MSAKLFDLNYNENIENKKRHLNTKAFLHSIRSSLNISDNQNENFYEQSEEKQKK